MDLGVRCCGCESSGVMKIDPGAGGDAERGVCVSTTVAGVSFEGDGERVSGGGVGVGSDEFDGGGMPGDTGDGSLTSGGGAGSVEPRC